jgi:hypothetical protein
MVGTGLSGDLQTDIALLKGGHGSLNLVPPFFRPSRIISFAVGAEGQRLTRRAIGDFAVTIDDLAR